MRDEHEMLIEYSEMTSFDFDSKEFQEVRKDYSECKDLAASIMWNVEKFLNNLKPVKNY